MANGSAPFLIAEDNALKQHLRGLTVLGDGDPISVGVWFRLPEAEERRVTYPFLSIDLVDITKGSEREHRGQVSPNYTPHGYAPSEEGFVTEFPIPVNLFYEITTHSRSAWHDRQLQAALLSTKLPMRFGALRVPTEEAGVVTVRELELLGVDPDDGLDANQKRLFRKIYSVRVSSELFEGDILARREVETVILQFQSQMHEFTVEDEGA